MTVEITEVRIKLMEEPGERLKAFCSITFDNCFVVRDLKIIDGSNGPFVAMPSRKLTSHCPGCGTKNHLRAMYCNQCGKRLTDSRAPKDADGRAKLYADIAHPINSFCREMIQDCVIQEYYEEIERAKQPDYVSRYDDFDFEFSDAPRSRPARFDQPHSQPSAEHLSAKRPATLDGDGAAPKPHFRAPASSDGADGKHARPTATDSFGAGIFPE
jgi:stage V sporulation protein G